MPPFLETILWQKKSKFAIIESIYIKYVSQTDVDNYAKQDLL